MNRPMTGTDSMKPSSRRIRNRLFLAVAFCAFLAQFASAADSSDRMAWFNQARFGMFIHWGIYSVPAGEYGTNKNYAEWIQLQAKIPGSEYEKFAAQFDPTNFNAKAWVRIAKDAGMKYIVPRPLDSVIALACAGPITSAQITNN